MASSSSACRIASITGALLIAMSSAAFAANPPASSMYTPTREMREKMATLHEQMAACLRSDKSISECRTEMRQHCQETIGSQGCTRMGMGPWMRGMGPGMRGGMMSNPPSSSSPPP